MLSDEDKLQLQDRLNTMVSARRVRRLRSDKVRYFLSYSYEVLFLRIVEAIKMVPRFLTVQCVHRQCLGLIG